MEVVGRALGWRTDQSKYLTLNLYACDIVQDLIYSIDPNQNGHLLFEEFILVLRYLEEKQL